MNISVEEFSVSDLPDETGISIEKRVGELLKSKCLTISTAESCTGGNIAALITSVPGSSAYYKGGIVAYANEIKTELLQVSPETIKNYGVVSKETVVEMAKGAMETLKTDCSIVTSGIAGPDGGTSLKPVGTVWMAVANKDKILTMKLEGDHGREQNILGATKKALFLLFQLVI